MPAKGRKCERIVARANKRQAGESGNEIKVIQNKQKNSSFCPLCLKNEIGEADDAGLRIELYIAKGGSNAELGCQGGQARPRPGVDIWRTGVLGVCLFCRQTEGGVLSIRGRGWMKSTKPQGKRAGAGRLCLPGRIVFILRAALQQQGQERATTGRHEYCITSKARRGGKMPEEGGHTTCHRWAGQNGVHDWSGLLVHSGSARRA